MKRSRTSIADVVIQNIKYWIKDKPINESDSLRDLGFGLYECALLTQRLETEFKIKYSDRMFLNFNTKPIREIINNISLKL